MPDSIKTYTGDESVRSYIAPQDYIDNSHIVATVDGVTITQSDELTTTTFILEDQSGTMYATFGSSIVLQGLEVIIKRVTPNAPLVVFENGSTYDANDQNTAYLQCLYKIVEHDEQG